MDPWGKVWLVVFAGPNAVMKHGQYPASGAKRLVDQQMPSPQQDNEGLG